MAVADPLRRSQIAALAADTSWAATEDWSSRTAPARAAKFEKYEAQVDPLGKLSPVDRAKRALKAEQAAMRVMSRRGVLASRRKQCTELLDRDVVLVTDDGETVRGVLVEFANDEITVADAAGEVLARTKLHQVQSLRGARRRRGRSSRASRPWPQHGESGHPPAA